MKYLFVFFYFFKFNSKCCEVVRCYIVFYEIGVNFIIYGWNVLCRIVLYRIFYNQDYRPIPKTWMCTKVQFWELFYAMCWCIGSHIFLCAFRLWLNFLRFESFNCLQHFIYSTIIFNRYHLVLKKCLWDWYWYVLPCHEFFSDDYLKCDIKIYFIQLTLNDHL